MPASPQERPGAGAWQRRGRRCCSQAVIPAPTRWCGKTSLCEKCLQRCHSPFPSEPGPCHAEAAGTFGHRYPCVQRSGGVLLNQQC